MSIFESFSGSEGVLKAQTEPFPVLLSRAAVSLAVLLLNRRHRRRAVPIVPESVMPQRLLTVSIVGYRLRVIEKTSRQTHVYHIACHRQEQQKS
jgi:hypothetical protein